MTTVTSADGTIIGFTRTGDGPPLILVDGALCYREFGPTPKIAEALASKFTVYTYDRRGRGQSADTAPYEPDREVDDIAALVKEAGGPTHLFGQSSGAVLALDAANSGLPVEKLALYEPPFIVDDSRGPQPAGFLADLEAMIDDGRPGDAVKTFMRFVGTPGLVKTEAIAPTLASFFTS